MYSKQKMLLITLFTLFTGCTSLKTTPPTVENGVGLTIPVSDNIKITMDTTNEANSTLPSGEVCATIDIDSIVKDLVPDMFNLIYPVSIPRPDASKESLQKMSTKKRSEVLNAYIVDLIEHLKVANVNLTKVVEFRKHLKSKLEDDINATKPTK